MSITLYRNGDTTALSTDTAALLTNIHTEDDLQQAHDCKPVNRFPEGYTTPPTEQEDWHRESIPTLAAFCFEQPGSFIGRHVHQVVAALTRRKVRVHLFARHAFGLDLPGIVEHTVGAPVEADLLAQVQEFTQRSCNAFLEQFPNGARHVTLLGHEWSTLPALSILRGIKGLPTLLSLHSLERQRSDLSSHLSQRIEEIELTGLHETRTLLIHNQATAEVAKFWAPECRERIVLARPRFPSEDFQIQLDPGIVKARYQVGPTDPSILFVGDLDARYGPDLLIKAMPAVLRNHTQARLIIVGDGSLYWPLRVYTRYLLLEHAVRLVGHVEGRAMAELMAATDIVAVPSRESTPWWPILAAWAARRPLVATHDAAPTLLEHERDSIRCYPSENSLVWGIERVLYDLDCGRAIANRGYEKLEERFGWNLLAEQIEELMGAAVPR
jgi:glycosyltransferase involved in cell wall biosynthesis